VVFFRVYVDDILLTGNELMEMQNLKSYLDQAFKIKDFGEANYFLRLAILTVPEGLVLTQRKFSKELLEEFGCQDMTSVLCPLDSTQQLSAEDSELFDNPSLYKKIIGKLNFLTNTRPDLAFAV